MDGPWLGTLTHRGVDMLLQELEPPILERALERAIVFIHRQREAIPAVDALRHVVHSPSCRNEQRGTQVISNVFRANPCLSFYIRLGGELESVTDKRTQ